MSDMSAPDVNGKPLLPKRSAAKGLMPSTWIGRTLRIEYVGAGGDAQHTSGKLLDIYPAGPVINLAGARTLLCWERLVICQLVED